jgi:hypothetical protein
LKYTDLLQAKHLHIVSFNVPYPANYGGVIDVYYKIKWLHRQGVKVHLHCFEYGREEAAELESICESVNYYPRKKGLVYSLHITPFIVLTRKSGALVQQLMEDNYPILLEGLHCCYLLKEECLKNRFKLFRESNIEHEYYFHLYKSETKFWQKLFYFIESYKLKKFEKVVQNSQLMLTVSQNDTDYFKASYPKNKVVYLPSFHPNDAVESLEGKGEYVLYHGNLAVAENYLAAKYILNEIAPRCSFPIVIAGLNPAKELLTLAEQLDHVKLIANPDEASMKLLVKNAHINLLLTFQATGLKLKLLSVLFSGRFCLVNKDMLAGTGLDSLCETGNSPTELLSKINALFQKEYSNEESLKRKALLDINYSNSKNVSQLIELCF